MAAMPGLLQYILVMFAYALSGALMMAAALTVLIKVWNWITPIDEWEELRKGNSSVAIVMAAVIIAFAIVMAAVLAPGHYIP